jgi:hypothetical protein
MTKTKADSETRTIHAVEDGMTAPGRVLYRGEELTLEVGSDHWELTIDPGTGRSWFDLSEDEQVERYGRVMFKPGPWPEKKPVIEAGPPLSPGEQEARAAWKDLEEGWREEAEWAKKAARPKFYSRTVRGGVVPDQFPRPQGSKE